jgi:hypothetical protein
MQQQQQQQQQSCAETQHTLLCLHLFVAHSNASLEGQQSLNDASMRGSSCFRRVAHLDDMHHQKLPSVAWLLLTHKSHSHAWNYCSACICVQALLRASLAAARLNHRYLTTPHILLGLLSATTSSSSSDASSLTGPACLAPAAGRYAEAEAAVRAMIDGPNGTAVSAAVGAAASLMTQSRGLDAVAWCGELSGRAQAVLLAAEQLRQQAGEAQLEQRQCNETCGTWPEMVG